MRHTIAIYLLMLYLSAAVFRPVMPVLMDGVAHLLWYKEHIETVHTHNGKTHVHAEIATAMADDAAATDTQHTSSTPVKSFKITDFLFAHFVQISCFSALATDTQAQTTVFSYSLWLNSAVSDVLLPPPNRMVAVGQFFQDSQYSLTYGVDALYRSKGVCTCFLQPETLDVPYSADQITIFFHIFSPHFLTITV